MSRNNHVRLAPVFFNHLYVVVDDKTYRSIQASDFLRDAFSGMETRATRTAAGESWSGTYYYGLDNYVEFFGESTGRHWTPSARAGWGGLAFSSDSAGGAEAVRDHIAEEFGYSPHFQLRKLVTPAQNVNWFYNVRLAETLAIESFDSWLMEYHPDIFPLKGIDYSDAIGPTRRAYLSPWNHFDDRKKQQRPRLSPAVFTRIVGATIHLDPVSGRRYTQILQSLGYQAHFAPGDILVEGNGFSLTIHLQAEPSRFVLSSFRLAMARKSVAPMTFVFAPGSRLVLNEDQTADWFFGD